MKIQMFLNQPLHGEEERRKSLKKKLLKKRHGQLENVVQSILSQLKKSS
jgi:hypothetical protein